MGLEAYLCRRRRGDQAEDEVGAEPPDAAGRRRDRLQEPRQTQLGRLPRGPRARQGERRPGAARSLLGGCDRADRLPRVAVLPPPRRGPSRRRPRTRRRPDRDLRRRQRLLRAAGERDPEQDKANEGIERVAREPRPAARRHRRRPLPAPRGLPQPCRPALRADEVDPRGAEAQLRDQRVLPEDRRGDARVVRALAGGDPEHARDRRSLQRRDQARRAAVAALPDAGRLGARGAAAPRRLRRSAPPLRRPGARRRGRAARVRARRHRGDGLSVLLPDRLGLRPLREGERDRGRPRRGSAARSSPTASASPISTRSRTTSSSSAS